MSRDFVHLVSEAVYLCPVQSWSKIAPKVRALSGAYLDRTRESDDDAQVIPPQ